MNKKLIFLSMFSVFIVLLVKRELGNSSPLDVAQEVAVTSKEEPPSEIRIEKIERKIQPVKGVGLNIETAKKTKSQILSNPEKQALPHEDQSIHYQKENGDIVITTVSVVDNMIIAHGDLIVGEVQDINELMERSQKGEPIVLPFPKLWKDGIIPYTIDDLPNKEEVKVAIETINNTTTVKWVPRDEQEDFVHFKSGPLNCYSALGRVGGKQIISLSEKCTRSSVAHEMLHTMGLLHEQNREDRDKYIQILWENIDKKNHLQFKKIKYKHLSLNRHKFDFSSIMLYRQNAFSKYPKDFSIIKTDGDTYYPGEELSPLDLKKIQSLYPPK